MYIWGVLLYSEYSRIPRNTVVPVTIPVREDVMRREDSRLERYGGRLAAAATSTTSYYEYNTR